MDAEIKHYIDKKFEKMEQRIYSKLEDILDERIGVEEFPEDYDDIPDDELDEDAEEIARM